MKVARTLRAFQRSDDFVRFIVGPVGSGKSSACVFEILRRAQRQRPGPDGVRRTRFAIIRNTYSQLRDTTRKTFEQWVPPRLGVWHEQSFTWSARWFLDDAKTAPVECEVLFRALDRPEDVKKLLSLELTGAYINEAREIPKHVLDVLETRIGRYPSKSQGGSSWRGIWADTNPWHAGHWGSKLFAKGLPGYRLFRQPGGRTADAENVSNLDRCWDALWLDADQSDASAVLAGKAEQARRLEQGEHMSPCGCYYKRLCVGKDKEWVRVYVDGEDASGAVGAIFGAWIAELEKRGGVCNFDHPKDDIFTSWDLGRSDSTAIWWWRLNRHGVPEVLDHYENHTEGMAHYFGIVDGKGYQYVKHWLPHDGVNETLATQQSVLDQCVARWGADKVAILPKMSIESGIQAARWMLEQPMRIHERCTVPARFEYSGVDALREYRFEWDEENQCFATKPLHNWASHTADAFRYLALVVKHSELMTRPPAKDAPKASYLSLETLFADREDGE